MAAKEILFNTKARQQIAHGLNTLANAVKVTLGPRGRNVVIEKSWGSPTVTKDGVTVAKEIELEDKFENMGAQMVEEGASKPSDIAGDDPMEIKRGIDAAVGECVDAIKKLSKATKGEAEIAQVGTISANGDE